MRSYLKANEITKDWGTPECYIYRDKIFRRHPDLALSLATYYSRVARADGYAQANRRLGQLHKKLTLGPQFHGIYIDSPEEDVKIFAERKSLAVMKLLGVTAKTQGHHAAVRKVIELVEECGLGFPLNDPKKAKEEEVAAAIARCCDAGWWRKKIRRLQDRIIEHVHIELGLVNKQKGIYASNFIVGRKQEQWKRNEKTLSLLVAENDLGQSFTLLDLAKRGVSNLTNRRNELMTRIDGMEKIAKSRGEAAVFYTLTAPSKYHACFARNGRPNPKYNGASPAATQDYFNDLWRCIRAKFSREDLRPYGLRVVEPHHDGTPHWHLLLFMPKEHCRAVNKIMRAYALAEDSNEAGAQISRLKIENIDSSKGSAVGYIAKYVAKNIDGESVGEDNYGQDAVISAVRIRAWASTWNIRQFQAIGGPSVTVWREVRRFASDETAKDVLDAIGDQLLNKIVESANDGDWQTFVELSGGPNAKRLDQPLRAHHVAKETPSKYGEVVNKIIGLLYIGQKLIKTRVRQWTVRFSPDNQNSSSFDQGFSVGGANAPPLESCQ